MLQRSTFTCENQRDFGQMNVLANNCVSKISVPKGANSGNGVAYNPVLGLFVTMDLCNGISVWDPMKGKVMAKRNLGQDGQLDMLILPGNRIAVSYSEGNHGGFIGIYSLEKGKNTFKAPKLYLKSSDLSPSGWTLDPGALSFSPQGNLLVAGSMVGNGDLMKLCMDWENLKVLGTRDFFLSDHEDRECKIEMVCCSVDSVILTREFDSEQGEYDRGIKCRKLCFEDLNKGNKEEDKKEEGIEAQEQAFISYYMLDGEENQLNNLRGFSHDGQNLIVANGDKIVLLESLTEGSNAHLIVSGLKPAEEDSPDDIGLNLNHKGQLMVCDDKAFIKVFEYKCCPRCLQDICRCLIHTGYSDKVKKLTIPSTLKDYLLYK